jgi:hypothetical protein
MANEWARIDFESVFPPELEKLSSTIGSITSAATIALEVQKGVTELLSAATTEALDTQAILIQAATNAINEVLDKFLGDAKLHLLVVPFRKQLNIRLPSDNVMPHDSDSDEAHDEDPLLENLERRFDEELQRVSFFEGGNQGYARTVIESLQDEFDSDRPQFEDDHAIFANVWVAGASDIIGILNTMYTLVEMFGKSLKNESFVPPNILRTPQDLKVKVIASPDNARIVTLLEWGNPPAEQTFAEFGEVRVRLVEVAIIRSTNDRVRIAHTWGDIFPGEQPDQVPEETLERTDVLTSTDGESEVILQFRYDGTRNSFIDERDFERDKDFYYAVAYRYALAVPPNIKQFTLQEYKLISNVEKVRIDSEGDLAASTGGVKPDWIATPNVLGLIPELQFYAQLLKSLVESLRSKALGANAALQSYADFLEAEIERFSDSATFVTSQVAKLNGLLQTPEAGIFSTFIESDTGGVDLFAKELARRLTDKTDPTAPPFFNGTEFVAGIVFMAGAPNPAELTNVKILFELLFGTPTENTPFEDAVESIDRVVSEREEIAFNESMEVVSADEVTTQTPQKTFNDALEPISSDDPDANVPFDP